MINNIFDEMTLHLIDDYKPSLYFNNISNTLLFNNYPLNMLSKLKSTEQSIKYHPEGNVWNHTMLVLDEAAKEKNKSKNTKVFMWAALLHDIGKPDSTKMRKGKITSYDHDKIGEKLAEDFLSVYTDDIVFKNQVCSLIRWHMAVLFAVKNLPYGNLKKMKQETDIDELSLLCLCDRLGRYGSDRELEESNISLFKKKVFLV